MADVFNKEPVEFVDLNELFPVLNSAVGLTYEQFRILVENTFWLKNQEEIGVLKAYIVSGSSQFGSLWLSESDGGSPLIPDERYIYIVETVGAFKNKLFSWNGSVYEQLAKDSDNNYTNADKSKVDKIIINGIDYLKDPAKTYLVIKTPADNDTFTLPTGTSVTPNYVIDWGDGTSDNITTTDNPAHEYAKAGMYLITISGAFENGIVFGASANENKNKIIEVYGGNNFGNYAFSGCTSLTTAYFPRVISIAGGAFVNCTSLTTAYFPSVISIGNDAFYDCTSLTTAYFPMVISIGSNTFNVCTSLTTAYFPNVTSIEIGVFYNCTSLKELTIGNVTTTGTGTRFENVKLTNLTIAQDATDTDIDRIKTFYADNGGTFSNSYELKYGLQVEKPPTADNDVVRMKELQDAVDTIADMLGVL